MNDEINETIMFLLGRVLSCHQSGDAMRYTQAAVNLSHLKSIETVEDIPAEVNRGIDEIQADIKASKETCVDRKEGN